MGRNTGNYEFRPLAFADLEFFNLARNAAAPFLHDNRLFSLEETIQWFEKGPLGSYWIVEREGIRIGYFRCLIVDSNTVMIGADIHPDFQGKGFSTSMYQEFAQSVLIPDDYKTCTLRVLRSNKRAQRLYLKLGFVQTGQTVEDFSMTAEVEELARGLMASS